MASRRRLSLLFLLMPRASPKIAKFLRGFGGPGASRGRLGTPLGQQKRLRGVLQGKRGEDEENTSPRPYFSPSDTLRDGFLAARGVLSRWYSSLPARDSASCAASRVFLAAISASMPASVALN